MCVSRHSFAFVRLPTIKHVNWRQRILRHDRTDSLDDLFVTDELLNHARGVFNSFLSMRCSVKYADERVNFVHKNSIRFIWSSFQESKLSPHAVAFRPSTGFMAAHRSNSNDGVQMSTFSEHAHVYQQQQQQRLSRQSRYSRNPYAAVPLASTANIATGYSDEYLLRKQAFDIFL